MAAKRGLSVPRRADDVCEAARLAPRLAAARGEVAHAQADQHEEPGRAVVGIGEGARQAPAQPLRAPAEDPVLAREKTPERSEGDHATRTNQVPPGAPPVGTPP